MRIDHVSTHSVSEKVCFSGSPHSNEIAVCLDTLSFESVIKSVSPVDFAPEKQEMTPEKKRPRPPDIFKDQEEEEEKEEGTPLKKDESAKLNQWFRFLNTEGRKRRALVPNDLYKEYPQTFQEFLKMPSVEAVQCFLKYSELINE
jgi:hypothetical protein